MNNGLFFKIIPVEVNIVFGSISGDLFLWNVSEDDAKPILYSYHIIIKNMIHAHIYVCLYIHVTIHVYLLCEYYM